MKFKLIEDINRGHEDVSSNELLDEKILLEYRGQTELRDFICELLNRLCGVTLNTNHYEIHHKDFYHDNNDPRNLVLLPTTNVTSSNPSSLNMKKPNTSLHNRVGQLNVFNNSSINKYTSNINLYSSIDVYRSIQRKSLVYLDSKLLKRDINIAKKHPSGRIR